MQISRQGKNTTRYQIHRYKKKYRTIPLSEVYKKCKSKRMDNIEEQKQSSKKLVAKLPSRNLLGAQQNLTV